MSKLEKMTPEQNAQLIPFREEWRKHGLSTERVDRKSTEEAITEMYRLIGKEKPIFIFCPSLIFTQFQMAYCREILPLIFEKRQELGANLGANLWDNLRANLRDNLRDNLGANLGANLWDNLRANLGANLGANLRANLRDMKVNYEATILLGSMDAYWIAYYEFPEKFLGLQYKPSDKQRLELWSKLAKSCSWLWTYENYCFVADRPESISMNSEYRLHNTEKAAITWVDGYQIHYINGREIPKSYFDKIKTDKFSTEDFFKENNEEIKSACIAMMQELYGEEHVFNFFRKDLREIDTYVNKKDEKYLVGTTRGMNVGVYTLFKGKINNENVAYVRCYCPSTDRMFYLGVDDKHSKAKDAIASLYRVPSKLCDHIKSISRQGERFCTILTDKGQEILSRLSEKEISETTGLTGEVYFKLMTYEF